MNTKNLISIIIPVYNTASQLHRCLNSVISQTYQDFECIIVDDGSSDQSPIICDQYAQKDPRIYVIHKQNEGVAIARKSGFYASHGTHILFLDADDWLEPDTLQDLFSFITQNNSSVYVFGYNRINQSGQILFQSIPQNIVSVKQLFEKYYDLSFLLWNKLISREILLRCNFSKVDGITFSEDSYISIHTLLLAQKVIFIPKAYYNYFIRDNSVTRKMSQKNHEDEIYATRSIQDLCTTYNIPHDIFVLQQKKFSCKWYLIAPDQDIYLNTLIKNMYIWLDLFPEVNHFYKSLSLPRHLKIYLWCITHHLHHIALIIPLLIRFKHLIYNKHTK